MGARRWPRYELEQTLKQMERLERSIDEHEPLAALAYVSLAHRQLGNVARVLVERARDDGEPWTVIGQAVHRPPRSLARIFR